MKDSAMRFVEHDVDGDQVLDLEEFYSMQPKQILDRFSFEQISQWFHEADRDGNGTLCANEFFMWSLGNITSQLGPRALELAFEKYDANKTGELDESEFGAVCNDLGFGSVSSDIFQSLDHDASGVLSYKEVVQGLQGCAVSDPEAKNLLSTIALAATNPQQGGSSQIDTTGWVIKGSGVATVRAELQRLLSSSGARVTDLIRLFDSDCNPSDVTIDDMEFQKAMRERFGFKGSALVLKEIFKSMDEDGGGAIGFDELYEFVHGRRHSLDPRNREKLDFQLVPREEATLDEVAWDGRKGVWALRVLIMGMLHRSKSGPSELLLAWTRRVKRRAGRPGLIRKEFAMRVRDNFFKDEHPDLWDSEVHAAANAAFDEMMGLVRGENFLKKIGIRHLNKWLAASAEEMRIANLAGRAPQSMLYGRVVERLVSELPFKTNGEYAQLLRRRRAAAKALEYKEVEKVDWVEKARDQIAAFCQLPPERAISSAARKMADSSRRPFSARARLHAPAARLGNFDSKPTPQQIIMEWREMQARMPERKPRRRAHDPTSPRLLTTPGRQHATRTLPGSASPRAGATPLFTSRFKATPPVSSRLAAPTTKRSAEMDEEQALAVAESLIASVFPPTRVEMDETPSRRPRRRGGTAKGRAQTPTLRSSRRKLEGLNRLFAMDEPAPRLGGRSLLVPPELVRYT